VAPVTAAMAAAASPWLVSPEAPFFRAWDPTIMLLLVITASLTPYEVAFLEEVAQDFDALWWLNRFIDVCFVGDMCLQFFVVRWLSTEQRYTTSARETTSIYIRGWFVIDFVSVFPWEFVGGMLNDESVQSLGVLRIVRLFRLLKLVRLVRASRILKRWEASLELRYSVMHLAYFLMLCVAVSHWLACLWRLSVDDLTRLDTWVGANRDTVDVTNPASVYVASLYFAVYSVTTAGLGDIAPQNDTERLVAILTLAIGASIYAYSVGSVSAIVASMDEANNTFHQTMDNLNAWMNDACIPGEMRAELRRYFHQTRSMAREGTYRRLLTHMSPTLRMRVASHCHAAWVREIPFLASGSVPRIERDTFVMELSLRLVPVAFAPDEAVIRHNEPATTMFIVKRGLIIRSLPSFMMSNRCDFRVGSPKVLGEDFIMSRYYRPYSVRTLTFLDGYSLDKKAVEQMLRHDEFPNTKVVLRRHVILSALKAKLPALALTFALMTRLQRRGSIGSESDNSAPGSPVADMRAVTGAAAAGRTSSTAADTVVSVPGSPARGSQRRALPGSPPHHHVELSLAFSHSTAAEPAGSGRRGSNLSLASTTRQQPSSLSEHAIAKQVNAHWESAKLLVGVMAHDGQRGDRASTPAGAMALGGRSRSFSGRQDPGRHRQLGSVPAVVHAAQRIRRVTSESSMPRRPSGESAGTPDDSVARRSVVFASDGSDSEVSGGSSEADASARSARAAPAHQAAAVISALSASHRAGASGGAGGLGFIREIELEEEDLSSDGHASSRSCE